MRTDFVSAKIRQIRAIRVLRRGKSAFIRVHLRLLISLLMGNEQKYVSSRNILFQTPPHLPKTTPAPLRQHTQPPN